jgi:hypothetical protein
MRPNQFRVTGLGWLSFILLLAAFVVSGAEPTDMKFRAFLLWGSNDSKPPEGRAYNLADLDIRQRLKDLPLKWTNWFEVNRKDVPVVRGSSKDVSMSDRCVLNVKQIEGSEVEVSLSGNNKQVIKRKQALPKGEMLVLGGHAPNSTAWLVVLKRVE